MRRITITDFRVIAPDGLVFQRPVFDYEVRHSRTWHALCTDDWVEATETRVLPINFENKGRIAWAAGVAFDQRAINNFAAARVDWQDQEPFPLLGDVIVRIKNRLWPKTWIPMESNQARQHLRDVQMDDVAVLSTRFLGGKPGCLIAASDDNRLAMAKLAVG